MGRVAVLCLPARDPADTSAPTERFDVVAVFAQRDRADRGALADALSLIAAGGAGVLVAERLETVAGGLGELVALLDWLDAAGADLVVLDQGLDTASASGRRTVSLLRELVRLEHRGAPGRPPRGRPGLLAREPELAERIAAMRAAGLSLQAIADALNAERVPTHRGGARWRPSSVQSALGYRRPRPPLHGAPPRPPPPPARPPPPPAPPPARGRRP